MMDKILELVASNGVWAVLFFFLLVNEIRDSRRREEKYQKTISMLNSQAQCIFDVRDDVGEIRREMVRRLENGAE